MSACLWLHPCSRMCLCVSVIKERLLSELYRIEGEGIGEKAWGSWSDEV